MGASRLQHVTTWLYLCSKMTAAEQLVHHQHALCLHHWGSSQCMLAAKSGKAETYDPRHRCQSACHLMASSAQVWCVPHAADQRVPV